MIEQNSESLTPIEALQASMGARALLGFEARGWGNGSTRAKAAFVGTLPPPNDEIANATVIGGTTTSNSESTSGATLAIGEPSTIATGVPTGSTVWHQYTPTTDGTVNFTTDGSNYDTTLQAYTLTDPSKPASYDNITQVPNAGNDDNDPGNSATSTINFPVVAGTTYYIQSGGYLGAQGNLTFTESGPVGVVCYVTGTLIRTDRGDVAVEDLRVGDLAVTSSGENRPVRWIGSRTIDCARHPQPSDVMPVRIAAGALGENRPARDLVVSPGHSLCLDVLGEVLIPASALVNGTTITQENVETVTYWHVELDSHEILIAEGQPAESYLEMGNRGFFAESAVVDLGVTPDAAAATRTHADFCRPFVDGGVVLDAVRAQIQARAERLGWRLDAAPWADMHLMVDGKRIEADTHGLTARFVLPASAQDVWLVSDTSVPRDIGMNADSRQLGLLLRALTVDDGLTEARMVALDDPLLCLGLHAFGEDLERWTAGRARLPAALFEGCRGTVFLRIELACAALPRWVAPEAAVVDETTDAIPRLSLVA